MRSFNIATLLAALPAIGPVVAALPEFKRLFDEIMATAIEPRDQDELKKAYALAIQDSDQAHADLQALVASRTGGGLG